MSDSTPSSSDAGPVRRRSWFRFSLRTLLIVFTGFTIWFGLFLDGVRRQYQAAEAIQAAYGNISYDWQVRSHSNAPGDQPRPPGPAWLRARFGPHWFDEIVEVRLSVNGNPGPANQFSFSVVGPRLVGLPRLNSLSLSGRERKHADYQLIGQLTQLKKLRLYQRSEFTREHAAALSQATALHELNFDGRVTADALRELARLPKLETFDSNCSLIDPATGFQLKEYWINDEHAKAIATLRQLRSLSLFNTLITNEGMAALCQLKQLEKLTVSSHLITSKSFEHVAKLKELKALSTWAWQVHDDDLPILETLPKLEVLDLLTHTAMTDEGLSVIARLSNLTYLRMRSEDITDANLHLLHGLTKLEYLDLSDTSITKNGVAAKRLRAALAGCKIRTP